MTHINPLSLQGLDEAQLAFCTNNLRKIKNSYKERVAWASCTKIGCWYGAEKGSVEQVHDKDVNVSSPALDLNIVKEQPVKHKEKSKPVVYRKRMAQKGSKEL